MNTAAKKTNKPFRMTISLLQVGFAGAFSAPAILRLKTTRKRLFPREIQGAMRFAWPESLVQPQRHK
jgi:hypothetical protein